MIRPVRSDGRIDTGGVFTPIERPRVVERIALAAQHRVVMLVAPAGYGKTTALRQYLSALREPVVRYDLHADNATLLGFVRGFADAISEFVPDARATVTSAYESAQSSPKPGAELAAWMHAHLKAYTGLIAIDDLHLAEDEPEVSRFLAALVDQSGERTHWLFASRSYLELPVGSWLAYQKMELAVDEVELRFTTSEAREVARGSRVGVRDEELERLIEMTEGWPTALSFALRSSTRSLDLSNIEVTTRDMVYRFLAEQVYASLDDDQREFLVVAALLSEIDIKVLNLAGYDDALARIEDLRHRGAFISVDPGRPGIYRCHDLFREFVKHQTGREGDVAMRAAHRRAGGALEAAGRIVEALFHYADAVDTESILRILEERGLDLMEEGNGDVIARAVEALDPEARASNGVALAMRGITDANAGRFEQAETLLHRAAELSANPRARAQFLLREARVAINRGSHGVRALLEGIADDSTLDAEWRLEARALLLVVLTRIGDREGALVQRERVLSEFDRIAISSPKVRVRVLQRAALATFELGDGLQARDMMVRVADDASDLGMHSLASKACHALAAIAKLYLHDPSQRYWYGQKAATAASKGGDMSDIQATGLQLLNIELERGNAEQVAILERRLASMRTGESSRLAAIATARAESFAWSGRFKEAYRSQARSWDRLFHAGDRLENGALCALFAACAGQAAEAKALIDRILILSAELPSSSDLVSVNMAWLFCALAQAILGRHTLAQRECKRMSEVDVAHVRVLKETVGVILRILRNPAIDGGGLEELLEQLGALGYGGYGKLLRAVMDHGSSDAAENAQAEALTRSEADVLTSLAMGLSPKEIAIETGRSVNTIQVHIQKAIQKLGCHGRQEAIAIARRRGLIA